MIVREALTNCARPGCECAVAENRMFLEDGRQYCSIECARRCTDEECRCRPCDCPQVPAT